MGELGWEIDRTDRLGGGGFGQVYAAVGPNGRAGAGKVVPKAPGAARELLVEDLPRSRNIVPVHAVEENPNEFILYMPRADKSLRQHLGNGPLEVEEAIDILTQIAQGLADLQGEVVHRDLKPENVLLVDGSWAICDFGIARYADATTAPDTRKFSMTPPYAAPEQWRHQRVTPATDIYALGVIAHELIIGERPFPGPEISDYHSQHLESTAPRLPTNNRLAALVDECLYKPFAARPLPANLIARLQRASHDVSSPGASALANAQSAVVAAQAAAHTAAEAARTLEERRLLLLEPAKQLYSSITAELVDYIQEGAPAVTIIMAGGGAAVLELGSARLQLGSADPVGPKSPWDVIAQGSIVLESLTGNGHRSHSLYYANFEDPDSFRWYELAFSGSYQADFEREPRASHAHEGISILGSRAFGTTQLAYGIRPLDPGNLDEFIDRWSERFGRAAQGNFPRVWQLPESGVVHPQPR